MKDWLLRGAIDSDTKLEAGSGGPGYHISRRTRMVFGSKQEMAKRGEASPHDADALALTWAEPVTPFVAPSAPRGDFCTYTVLH